MGWVRERRWWWWWWGGGGGGTMALAMFSADKACLQATQPLSAQWFGKKMDDSEGEWEGAGWSGWSKRLEVFWKAASNEHIQ